jgi:hypothetical protein
VRSEAVHFIARCCQIGASVFALADRPSMLLDALLDSRSVEPSSASAPAVKPAPINLQGSAELGRPPNGGVRPASGPAPPLKAVTLSSGAALGRSGGGLFYGSTRRTLLVRVCVLLLVRMGAIAAAL